MRAGSKVVLALSQVGMVGRAGAAKPDIGSVDAFQEHAARGRVHRLFG